MTETEKEQGAMEAALARYQENGLTGAESDACFEAGWLAAKEYERELKNERKAEVQYATETAGGAADRAEARVKELETELATREVR